MAADTASGTAPMPAVIDIRPTDIGADFLGQ
ncbi:hypothetical protein J2X35_002855 [Mesorhizobium sp. BE184]|nr:hypothetical protein [Mesorhizobium sp. BE184]